MAADIFAVSAVFLQDNVCCWFHHDCWIIMLIHVICYLTNYLMLCNELRNESNFWVISCTPKHLFFGYFQFNRFAIHYLNWPLIFHITMSTQINGTSWAICIHFETYSLYPKPRTRGQTAPNNMTVMILFMNCTF